MTTVLDRKLSINQSYLLEASAGTGKTYSIENIYVRLLVEGHATVDQILVVTFTRAATAELKQRIRQNIVKVLDIIKNQAQCPDYLQAILEKDEKEIDIARRHLEQALFCFDQSQIFTIHGFCSRMLKEQSIDCNLSLDNRADETKIPSKRIHTVIKDYFRTEVNDENYSKGQIKILLNKYKNDQSSLERALCKLISSGSDILPSPAFNKHFILFSEAMNSLKKLGYCSSKLIMEDFFTQAPSYKEICNKQGIVKSEFSNPIGKSAKLFDQSDWTTEDFDLLIEQGLLWLDLFHPSKLRVKSKADKALHYPQFLNDLQKNLFPIVSEARNPLSIYARIAHGCQKLFRMVSQEEELPLPDDLLQLMSSTIENPNFVKNIRKKYRAAIIDEFQDTDPIQWKIFHSLFGQSEECSLYLVGDPKQSIYAFRQADIYTYLSAAEHIPSQNRLTLDTNYRSQPSLVEALNTLFSKAQNPPLISLPRTSDSLKYQNVKASPTQSKEFFDDKESVHFFIAKGELGKAKTWPTESLEQESFFPFITSEIQSLTETNGWHYDQFAILVKDRFQAERIAAFFRKYEIPCQTQKGTNLADSKSLSLLQELLQAVLNPRNHSSVKIALGNRLIGWNHQQIRSLADQDKMIPIMSKFYDLQNCLKDQGFGYFYQEFLKSKWHEDGMSVAERILEQEGGLDYYRELEQIVALVMEHQTNIQASAEELVTFLKQFEEMRENEDERLKGKEDHHLNAVQILTLHMSKGLEFDVVFALGLANRTPIRNDLIPIFADNKKVLTVPTEASQEAIEEYYNENDAEKMRQLYVAMTRAKFRLYLPVAIPDHPLPMPLGSASPMELFLARFTNDDDTLYNRINTLTEKTIVDFIDANPHSISYTILDQPIELAVASKSSELVPLVKPNSLFKIPGIPSFVHSFSSLAKDVPQGTVIAPILDKNEDQLPLGADVGVLFHTIFEKIPFHLYREMKNSSESLHLIRPFLNDLLAEKWESAIAEIVFQTLKTPLPSGFSLSEIDLNNSFREMEFLYPYSKGLLIPEECNLENNFLKGFIDLVFEHNGLYYIVDWKSNWLGPNHEDYDTKNLEQAMNQHNYHLQATIYAEALKRYLKLVDNRPFEKCFGGTYYLFIRGINSQLNGIYQWKE